MKDAHNHHKPTDAAPHTRSRTTTPAVSVRESARERKRASNAAPHTRSHHAGNECERECEGEKERVSGRGEREREEKFRVL
jgi:hypothetical protein